MSGSVFKQIGRASCRERVLSAVVVLLVGLCLCVGVVWCFICFIHYFIVYCVVICVGWCGLACNFVVCWVCVCVHVWVL